MGQVNDLEEAHRLAQERVACPRPTSLLSSARSPQFAQEEFTTKAAKEREDARLPRSPHNFLLALAVQILSSQIQTHQVPLVADVELSVRECRRCPSPRLQEFHLRLDDWFLGGWLDQP